MTVLAVILGNFLFQWIIIKMDRFVREMDSYGNDNTEDYDDEHWF